MADGFILLHRQLTENFLWKDKPFTRGQAWIDLLFMASYKDNSFWCRGVEVEVKAGQVAISSVKLSERWGWSRAKLRRFLSCLQTGQQIVQQKNNVTTLITIVNWELYQKKGQQTEQQKDSRKTAERHNQIKEKKVNNKTFMKPTLEMVKNYCLERGNQVDAQRFLDHYDSNGWMVGKTKMKDWKASVRTWERNETQPKSNHRRLN